MSEYVLIKELTDTTAIHQVSLGRPISISKSIRVYDETFDKVTSHELTRNKVYGVELSDTDTVIRFVSPYYKKFDRVRIEVKYDLSNPFEYISQIVKMSKDSQTMVIHEKLEQLYRLVLDVHATSSTATTTAISVFNESISGNISDLKLLFENHLHDAALEKINVRADIDTKIAEYAASTKGDVPDTTPKPNPDQPLPDAIKALVDWMHTAQGKFDDESTLDAAVAAHLASIDAALANLAEGDTLNAALKDKIMTYLKTNGYFEDQRTHKLMDAGIIRAMRLTQADGSHRSTKTGLPDSYKPQFWDDEKSIAPLPETMLPTRKEIALTFANSEEGASGVVQVLFNKLRTTLLPSYDGPDITYDAATRAKLVELDSSLDAIIPPAGTALVLNIRRSIVKSLGTIDSCGIKTVMNLATFGGGYSEIVKPVSFDINYETYWESAQLYNSDGTQKIVDGEQATQKVDFKGRGGPDQIAEIFSKSVFGQNLIRVLNELKQPGQDDLPVSWLNTAGIPITEYSDFTTLDNSYEHLNSMKPGFISLKTGLKVVPSTKPDSLGKSKLAGTGEVVNSQLTEEIRTQIVGILARVVDPVTNKEYLVEMDPASLAAETEEANRVNKELLQTFANNMKYVISPAMSALGSIGSRFRTKTNYDTKVKLDEITDELIPFFNTFHAELQHLLDRLQNPQRFIRRP